jgi:hypothetical protein
MIALHSGRRVLAIGCLLFLAALTSGPVLAMTVQNARDVPFVVAFGPTNVQSYPFTGTMKLNFNNGIVSGTYLDNSIKPGSPLAGNHWLQISGGYDNGHIRLRVGNNFEFNGNINGPEIDGRASARGRFYDFEARQGTLPGSKS